MNKNRKNDSKRQRRIRKIRQYVQACEEVALSLERAIEVQVSACPVSDRCDPLALVR